MIYVYERSDAAPVTVKFKDVEGNQLSEPTILSGKVGLPYESEAKEIPGWYVVETPANAHGVFSEEAQEVIYIYERSDAAPVTVKYKDSDGNQLSEPTILSGKVGLPYESEAKEIPGWYVAETPSNASGVYSEEPQEVLYIYAILDNEETDPGNTLPDPEEENDPGNTLPDPEQEADPENTNSDPEEETNSGNTVLDPEDPDSGGNLPNTGETLHGQKIMIGLGVLLVFFSLIVVGEKRKRKHTK